MSASSSGAPAHKSPTLPPEQAADPSSRSDATTWLIEKVAIATVDAAGTEHASGYLSVSGGRVAALGEGSPPDSALATADRRIDGSGCLLTPGLVNTHHHFYQWLTRGLVPDSDLFSWLTALYPRWALLDAEMEHAAALGSLAALVRSGCTTTMDHHYVFPSDGGDLLAAEIEAASLIGVRFHPARGSMDLGRSAGGLPPDDVVEETEAALEATEEAIARYHDPSPGSMCQVAVAPCSPFSVSPELLVGARELARRHGVRLHTHLAETADEEAYCNQRFGCSPLEYVESLGWLGEDVWLAHGVHLAAKAISALAATRTGVAHCPSSNSRLGAGVAPLPELLAAGVPVGLGVDGSASNEAGELGTELRSALLTARARKGPTALSTRQALAIATMGGALCLGRGDEIGSLEVGKLADLALWRLDTPAHVGIADPVAALTLGSLPPLELLLVGGKAVVEAGELTSLGDEEIAAAVGRQAARLARRAGLN